MSNVEQVENFDMPKSEAILQVEVVPPPKVEVIPKIEYEEPEIVLKREIESPTHTQDLLIDSHNPHEENEIEDTIERKPLVGLEELDFEDETNNVIKTEKTEEQSSASNEASEPIEKKDGECSEKPNDKSIEEGEDDGECSDEDDLEEGELKDPEEKSESMPKEKQRQVCRFFNRGVCFYGLQCRFLHLNSELKGNYNMFAPTSRTYDQSLGNIILPTSQLGIMHNQHRSALRSVPDFLPGPPIMPCNQPVFAQESAWERGLKEAKELVKKASKRKLDPDFENKRLNLSLNANERNEMNDKENDKYPKKKRDDKKNDLFKYDPPYCDVEYDRGDTRGGGQYDRRFENFEDNRGRGLDKKSRRKSPERMEKGASRFGQKDWRNDVAKERGRGETYFDPWRRSKSPKNRRLRERSRSFGSYSSVSSYSSRSSCSYSRSSSQSSRDGSSRSSSRSRSASRGRSPVYSRSSHSSRSISMDSVSSASSSVSHSSSGHSLVTPSEHEALLRAQEAHPISKADGLPGLTAGGLFFQTKKFDKITVGLKNPEYDPLEEKFQNSKILPNDPYFSNVQNLLPAAEKERVKEPIKGLHPPKQQIKLTLLNKNPQSKLSSLPKKDLDLNRVMPQTERDEMSKLGGFNLAFTRPVTPPPPLPPGVLMKPVPPPTVVPKKSASSRRDELLKQLKAVEDAIARKRAKFC
ncbi:c3H1-type domain-containing protein [Nephila pilipes]|uniref:C3H1-type domain-containing protein n=1 Tax=Nephila pilipes TaxID=299642 RepID=A0A8X6IWS9_NEPPI|nr:c3H1-type domain-containing protein [Nephila pilipes]